MNSRAHAENRIHRFCHLHRPSPQSRRQIFAAQVFHHDVGLAPICVEVVDSHHVGMAEPADGLGLACEAPQQLRVRHIQCLDRDISPQHQIPSRVPRLSESCDTMVTCRWGCHCGVDCAPQVELETVQAPVVMEQPVAICTEVFPVARTPVP